MDDDLGDELLGLIFTACHPILSPDARAALTLRVIGGLTTDEIARAFLTSEATIAQRIVRAKKTIGKAGLTFETPRGPERAARLPSVLEVIYLIFNEGYAATAGDDLVRPSLCLEAQRLGRMLTGLMPEDAEVFGLLALMEIQASRLKARIGPDGALLTLNEQNCARWDHLMIRRGLDALARAEALGGDGPYALASRACSLPCAGAQSGRHRLVPHRSALRSAPSRHALAGGRSQSSGRLQHGLRARSGPQAHRRDRRRRGAAQLCAIAGGKGRFSVSGRPTGRGPPRI